METVNVRTKTETEIVFAYKGVPVCARGSPPAPRDPF